MAAVYKTRQQLEDEDTERYLKKKEEIFERRRAKREGYKCTMEGCGLAFKEPLELKSHVNDHQEEYRRLMKCNQAKCGGVKFTNRRAYNEHVETHRAEAKVKVMNNIRSVLLYNKHGLLMEAFEMEFRSMIGKHVPYKLCGYNSCYGLVNNCPDVVQVTHLDGGQTLLLAVPDKSTEHIAKMVGTQRSNREGFNRRTGDVLASVGRDAIRKIEKAIDVKNRVVPEFMKKQLVQLNVIDVFDGGLDLFELRQVYDQEYGYPLEFRCYGFYTLEDFVFHGLAGVVDLELNGVNWKISPSRVKNIRETPELQGITSEVRSNIKKLLEENPFGLSVTTFLRIYEGSFGQLDLRQPSCKDLVELCCLIPESCRVQREDDGEGVTILPANGRK